MSDGQAAADDKPRFAAISEAELNTIIDNKDALNTKRSTNQSVNIFRAYLEEKNFSNDIESIPVTDLDSYLGKFYAEARNKNGELYKKSSLTTFRYGLSRYIDKVHDVDIKKDSRFRKSENIFKAVSKDLKRQGLGSIEHYPPIEEADLQKAYYNLHIYDPKQLQQKVFMDIMLYFGRRGRENLRDLKINDFALTTDADGLRYIYLTKDELTKNHADDTNTAHGRMYEIKDDDYCPVRTFCRYKSKLSTASVLFQRPKRVLKDDSCWYDAAPVGHNILGTMMSSISSECKLSKIYTNHSLRATTVHILDAARIPDRHIMSVTSHKSETSLKTYTGYTDSKTKQKMSNTLSSVIRSKGSVPSTSAATNSYPPLNDACFELLPLTNSQEDRLVHDLKTDIEFDEILKTISDNSSNHGNSNQNVCPAPRIGMNNKTLNMQSVSSFHSPGMLPMIQNYGTININYQILQNMPKDNSF